MMIGNGGIEYQAGLSHVAKKGYPGWGDDATSVTYKSYMLTIRSNTSPIKV